MAKITIAGHTIRLPKNRALRMLLGAALVLGGLFSFLPVLGVWMIPLGMTVLAVDVPAVRRLHRRVTVAIGNRLHRRWPGIARWFGYGEPRSHRKT